MLLSFSIVLLCVVCKWFLQTGLQWCKTHSLPQLLLFPFAANRGRWKPFPDEPSPDIRQIQPTHLVRSTSCVCCKGWKSIWKRSASWLLVPLWLNVALRVVQGASMIASWAAFVGSTGLSSVSQPSFFLQFRKRTLKLLSRKSLLIEWNYTCYRFRCYFSSSCTQSSDYLEKRLKLRLFTGCCLFFSIAG